MQGSKVSIAYVHPRRGMVLEKRCNAYQLGNSSVAKLPVDKVLLCLPVGEHLMWYLELTLVMLTCWSTSDMVPPDNSCHAYLLLNHK